MRFNEGVLGGNPVAFSVHNGAVHIPKNGSERGNGG